MKVIASTALALGTIALLGCTKQQEPPRGNARFVPDADLPLVQKKDLDSANQRIEALENRVLSLELTTGAYSSGWFDPTGDRSYQRVDANVGQFLVVLDHVQPYLDGQRITLLIGNPNNVTFAGLEIKATWQRRTPATNNLSPEERSKAWTQYNASRQEKEIKLTDTLRSGYWNKVQFNIAPAKTEEFGQLGIELKVNQVRLLGGK